jgi:FKBP-type peptidyl-prolyl cis-trans isomerase FkpA
MKRFNSILSILFFLGIIILAGCGGPECNKGVSSDLIAAVDQTQLKADIATIDDYLVANNIKDVQKEPNGIRYVISKAASGGTPCLENQITVIYEGKFLSTGKTFDSSQGTNFILKDVILGWQIMFSTFPKGTKATIYIPSGYAYGSAGRTSIPANANLIFTIELLAIR